MGKFVKTGGKFVTDGKEGLDLEPIGKFVKIGGKFVTDGKEGLEPIGMFVATPVWKFVATPGCRFVNGGRVGLEPMGKFVGMPGLKFVATPGCRFVNGGKVGLEPIGKFENIGCKFVNNGKLGLELSGKFAIGGNANEKSVGKLGLAPGLKFEKANDDESPPNAEINSNNLLLSICWHAIILIIDKITIKLLKSFILF